MGFGNEDTLFDAKADVHLEELQRKTAESLPFAAGHWQGDAAQDGDANGDHYQTFEVDEDHDTSLTPEKTHFKSNEVDSPDVIPLTIHHKSAPPPNKQLMMKTMRKQLMCGMSPGLEIAQWMNELIKGL